jgi:tRNA (guanine-N7-)-methyltransferase
MSSTRTPGQSPDTASPLRRRLVRSFGSGRGRITRAQERAYREVFPRYAVPYQAQAIDPEACFGRKAPLVLEIGFGMGETTAAIAAAKPQLDFLAVEVFAAGIGALAMHLARLELTNVRIVQHDAVEVVRDMLSPGALAAVHIFFPDPWPKARHHKRRLITPAFISSLAQRLAPSGIIHCATDWQHYAEHMLDVLSHEPSLSNLHRGFAPALNNPLCDRPATKFHARGQRLGHPVWDLVFQRTPTPTPLPEAEGPDPPAARASGRGVGGEGRN